VLRRRERTKPQRELLASKADTKLGWQDSPAQNRLQSVKRIRGVGMMVYVLLPMALGSRWTVVLQKVKVGMAACLFDKSSGARLGGQLAAVRV
jgi:hypothetical protein